MIAHRLSTIKNADIIVGIERGQVVEYGTHEQLMQRKGLYYELVTAQSEKERNKGKDPDSDREDQMEEELARLAATEPIRPRTRRASTMLRRSSVVSAKSVASEISDAGHELSMIEETQKKPFFRTPLLVKVAKLNSPEWFYLLLGGIASLASGAVMPVSIFSHHHCTVKCYVLFLTQCFSLVFSEVFGALAEIDPRKQEERVRTYTYTIFLIGVGGALFQMISSLSLAKAGEELTLRMRALSFKAMLRQEIGWFDLDENNLGALVTRLSTDAAALKGFTGPTLSALLTAVGAMVAALVISFTAGWKLTLVVLCFAPLMVFTGIIQGQQISQAGQKKSGTSDAEDGGKVSEHFQSDDESKLIRCHLVRNTSHRKHSNGSFFASRRTFYSTV